MTQDKRIIPELSLYLKDLSLLLLWSVIPSLWAVWALVSEGVWQDALLDWQNQYDVTIGVVSTRSLVLETLVWPCSGAALAALSHPEGEEWNRRLRGGRGKNPRLQ
jgi:hypothetical protein